MEKITKQNTNLTGKIPSETNPQLSQKKVSEQPQKVAEEPQKVAEVHDLRAKPMERRFSTAGSQVEPTATQSPTTPHLDPSIPPEISDNLTKDKVAEVHDLRVRNEPMERRFSTAGDPGQQMKSDLPDASPNIDQLLAEAEARGYERGRRAGIEAWINESRTSPFPPSTNATHPATDDSEIMILNNMRRSVWD